jgi:hypothetical protein
MSLPFSEPNSKPSAEHAEADKLSVLLLVLYLNHLSTMKMEVMYSSETSGCLRSAQRYKAVDRNLQIIVLFIIFSLLLKLLPIYRNNSENVAFLSF